VPFAPSQRFDLALDGSGISRPTRRLLLVAALLAGCSGGVDLVLPGDGQPAAIGVVHGDGQSGRIGEPLKDSVVVEVTDSRGQPVEGVSVAFEVMSGGPGADIVPKTATTDANGQADTRMALGTTIGTQTGRARVVIDGDAEAPKATFTAIVLSEDADGMAAVSGDDQSGPAGSTLPLPLVVQVTDEFGNPIANVPVSWMAQGGGTVSSAVVNTNGQGRASVQRTLGPTAGQQTTVASSEGLAGSPVTFVHTATAGNAAGLSIVSGNNQTAEVGTRLPADLVVRLTDSEGNGVPQAAVTWVVSTGGGSVTPQNGVTDDAGRASANWTLGPAPGENRLDAVVSGVGIANFRATGTSNAPGATTTTITSDSPDPSVAGATVTVGFRVTSSSGATPTGTVSVTVIDGGANCTGTLSGGAGSCQLILNGPGDRTLKATYSGAPGLNGSSDTEPHRVNPAVPGNRPPDADYNWHCEGLTCQFTDASSDGDGSVSRWHWNFGDGSTSTVREPTHTYPAAGTYLVTLTVTDDDGATDESTAHVEVEGPAPPPPPASTTTTITSDDPDPSIQGAAITVGFTVTSSSGTPSGTVQVSDANGGGCSGSAPSGSCSYTPTGVGTRTITAAYPGNSSFNASSDTESHTVNAPPVPNQPPSASFTWSCDDLECDFEDQSNDSDGSIEDWDWNFGDGATSDDDDPSHEYSAGGTYMVTLTVTDDDEASSSVTHSVTVSAPPPPNQPPTAAFSPPSCITGQPCQFTDGSTDSDGTVEEWEWDFGDSGAKSTERNPAHIYGGNGTYTVKLKVKDDDGLESDEVEHEVQVNDPPPAPNAAPTARIGSIDCSGMDCRFTDDSTDPDGDATISRWSWIFGDGNASDQQNPVHRYAAPGPYTVTLTVADNRGLASDVPDQERITVSPTDDDDD
jgi:PKD repeat protein